MDTSTKITVVELAKSPKTSSSKIPKRPKLYRHKRNLQFIPCMRTLRTLTLHNTLLQPSLRTSLFITRRNLLTLLRPLSQRRNLIVILRPLGNLPSSSIKFRLLRLRVVAEINRLRILE